MANAVWAQLEKNSEQFQHIAGPTTMIPDADGPYKLLSYIVITLCNTEQEGPASRMFEYLIGSAAVPSRFLLE